ncbi:MAG TPA: GNAT family N-acetyltransferase [Pyrinomonadaceae bacterium]|jgi:ribosomal-protein-alanine N-acetyltransferase
MNEIKTSRLHLRQFTPDDLDELAVIFSDPLVLKYLQPAKAATREETNTALLSMIRHWQRHGYGRWAVMHRPTRKLVGYGGLRCFDGTPELVYLLARNFWNCGLATELARACLEYGFLQHSFERVIAVARPENLASRRVMEKVGFTYERIASFFDIEVAFYSLTRSAYFAQSLAMHTSSPSLPASAIK